ncbi:hypothetical protein [Hydrogenophaga sp.]|uniref:hypothetical protein n=1 Tax=Hydrogenophaga sp. TaxID=1904254 RepID=UPI002718956C|nr:hypothetical protein [Hydrogenophaga sp.]MDO9436615.1 hypothetical protein [Hydrogenophaga sp.]
MENYHHSNHISRWQPIVNISKNARPVFDEKMRSYLRSMESLRLLSGANSSGELQAAWLEGQAEVLDGEWVKRVFDHSSKDLKGFRWLAAYNLVKVGAPGDIKRSTKTTDGTWTKDRMYQAKRAGNFMAGILGRHVGLSDQDFELAAGVVQMMQDSGYVIDGVVKGRCSLQKCWNNIVSDHDFGSDDNDGLYYSGLGRSHQDSQRRKAGADYLRSLKQTSEKQAALSEHSESSLISDSSSINDGSTNRSSDREGSSFEVGVDDQRTGSTRYRYLDVIEEAPGITYCANRDGCS